MVKRKGRPTQYKGDTHKIEKHKKIYDGKIEPREDGIVRTKEKVNDERLDVLDDFRATEEEIQEDHDRRIKDLKEGRLLNAIDHDDGRVLSRGFKKRWWKFDKETDGKVPLVARWAYTRLSGTGQFISFGLTFSVGPSWGAFVINVPMVELTIGYVPSPMSL